MRMNATGEKWRCFGYTPDGTRVLAHEADMLVQAARDHIAGIPLRTITTRWNDAGERTPRGNRWTGSSLRRVLLNPRLIGRKHTVPGSDQFSPPLMDEHIFEQVGAILSARSGIRHVDGKRLLSSGVLRCGVCDAEMQADVIGGVRKYRCKERRVGGALVSCASVTVNGIDAEQEVVRRTIDILQGYAGARIEVGTYTFAALSQRIVGSKQREIAGDFAAGLIDADVFKRELARLGREFLMWKRMRGDGIEEKVISEQTAWWWEHDLTDNERRNVVRNVWQSIVVGPYGKGRARAAERLEFTLSHIALPQSTP